MLSVPYQTFKSCLENLIYTFILHFYHLEKKYKILKLITKKTLSVLLANV